MGFCFYKGFDAYQYSQKLKFLKNKDSRLHKGSIWQSIRKEESFRKEESVAGRYLVNRWKRGSKESGCGGSSE